MFVAAATLKAQQAYQDGESPPRDWVCLMDPDVRSDKSGVCPRCGMKLTLDVPDSVEHLLDVTSSPSVPKPAHDLTLSFRVSDPETGRPVRQFEIVHEKLMHVFIVSENLEFFAHEHPELGTDGSFRLTTRLPYGGMYRMLVDFYPAGARPQLSLKTFFVQGQSPPARLAASFAPVESENLTAALRLEPALPLAGLQTRLFFTLRPAAGLERYLGAWGHLLAASEDLIDFLHIHPFLVDLGGIVQFNVVFPRPGLYRLWVQFQRLGAVNTAVFTVPVSSLEAGFPGNNATAR
jgi:hypothetical protein